MWDALEGIVYLSTTYGRLKPSLRAPSRCLWASFYYLWQIETVSHQNSKANRRPFLLPMADWNVLGWLRHALEKDFLLPMADWNGSLFHHWQKWCSFLLPMADWNAWWGRHWDDRRKLSTTYGRLKLASPPFSRRKLRLSTTYGRLKHPVQRKRMPIAAAFLLPMADWNRWSDSCSSPLLAFLLPMADWNDSTDSPGITFVVFLLPMADWNPNRFPYTKTYTYLSTTYGRLKPCIAAFFAAYVKTFYYLWQIETAKTGHA